MWQGQRHPHGPQLALEPLDKCVWKMEMFSSWMCNLSSVYSTVHLHHGWLTWMTPTWSHWWSLFVVYVCRCVHTVCLILFLLTSLGSCDLGYHFSSFDGELARLYVTEQHQIVWKYNDKFLFFTGGVMWWIVAFECTDFLETSQTED